MLQIQSEIVLESKVHLAHCIIYFEPLFTVNFIAQNINSDIDVDGI